MPVVSPLPDCASRGIDLGLWVAGHSGFQWDELAGRAERIDGNAEAATDVAREIGGRMSLPGDGDTAERWVALATPASVLRRRPSTVDRPTDLRVRSSPLACVGWWPQRRSRSSPESATFSGRPR